MAEDLEITIGAHADFPLQCWNRGGETTPSFGPSDLLSAYVYLGQDQGPLFAATVAWLVADPDTGAVQTGYDQGQIVVTIASSQSATLEPNGTYSLLVWRTPAGATDSDCIWEGSLLALPAAGSATRTVVTYCTYADMLFVAPWLRNLQSEDTDQEGYYSERLQAREWLDNIIIRSYRGNWAVFGDATQPAANWSGWGSWRTPMMSPWIKQQLDANKLVVTRQIARMCAYRAAGIVGLSQMTGGKNSYAAHGQWLSDRASEELQQTNAEFDSNGDGFSDLVIPLGQANVIYQ